jgi:nitrate/TMAO reductase-like tetraheme cytochrome c subunit
MNENAHISEPSAAENAERLFARGFVVAGGMFWVVAAFAGPYAFQDTSLAESLATAMWPFLATVVTLVVGWRYERLAAMLLLAASAALFAWGIINEWEIGVWILMAFVMFSPLLIAAILFFLASRAEDKRLRAAEPETSSVQTPSDEGVEGTERRGLRGWRRPALKVWLPGAAFGVIAFAFAVPVYYTATPSQCATCHSMEPYYESWRDSDHRSETADCIDCHVEPGFGNLVRYEIEFYGEIVGHLAGADVEMAGVSTPGLQSCQRSDCHALDEEPFSELVLLEHEAHVQQEHLECPDCHDGVVHEGVAGRSIIPPMEQCSECHEDEMGDCAYCHEDGPPEPLAPDTH